MMHTSVLRVHFQSELESLATRKGTFDPEKHPKLLELLDGGFTNLRERQTHAEDLLDEYIASCPGQFAFPRGFKPSEEQLREALHILLFDPEKRSVMDRHEEIIVNVFGREDVLPNGKSKRHLGWSRESFKRDKLRLLLKHLAQYLAEQVADEDEAA